MSLEIYWKKALEQTRLSIEDKSLYPVKTDIITRDLYEKDDFIIRKLDTSKFNKKKIYGPKQNPFCPWEKILEIDKIGDYHQLILNKYPVQKGHILLITNKWIAIIKRKNDHIHGFSINGLGFAGYLLVTENSNINYLKKLGPEKLLENFV